MAFMADSVMLPRTVLLVLLGEAGKLVLIFRWNLDLYRTQYVKDGLPGYFRSAHSPTFSPWRGRRTRPYLQVGPRSSPYWVFETWSAQGVLLRAQSTSFSSGRPANSSSSSGGSLIFSVLGIKQCVHPAQRSTNTTLVSLLRGNDSKGLCRMPKLHNKANVVADCYM